MSDCPGCGRPRVLVGTFAVCRSCRKANALSIPNGVDIAYELPRQAGYREPQSGGAYVVRHAWRSRWVLSALVAAPLGVIGTLSGITAIVLAATGHRISGGALLGIAVLAVGAVVLYVVSANLANHTRIRLSRTTVAREHGPLPWPGASERRRSEGDDVGVLLESRRSYDVRNVVPLPAPETFAIVLKEESGGRTLLLEQFLDRNDALAAAALIREAIAATA